MVEKVDTPYQLIGEQKLSMLVDAFYRRVKAHPDLSPIFPDDLTNTAQKQKLFLTQFLGGPPLYSERYGHPMLRARHLPFPITPKRANAWLACMNEALDEVEISGPLKEYLMQRFTLTAHHMVNQPEHEGEPH
ncbi:globin [Aeribacillus pallidus]|jgi:hemoglobin|uniref:globin domain-containing protein n=1 Tax=Aeribacillus pallidus TaxID=33936 RepID=UPI003D219A3C